MTLTVEFFVLVGALLLVSLAACYLGFLIGRQDGFNKAHNYFTNEPRQKKTHLRVVKKDD